MSGEKSKIVIIFILILFSLFFHSCTSGPRTKDSNIVELENKGTVMEVPTPDWVKIYIEKGLSALQAQYPDRYCVIGEESGVNRHFVLTWADSASAQQRIGALVRTNIASRYEAAITATAQSGAESSGRYQQEINNVLSAIINVSFSGAQREADWWSLRRRYEPGNKEIYSDEYTAWVLYTVPKEEMNRQVALAMETSIARDSALYDVTIALARDILLQGYDTNELQSAAAIQRTASNNYDPPGTLVARAISEIDLIDEYVLGRDSAALILSNYKLYTANPSLTKYVNLICNTLVINSPKPSTYNGYFVAILDSDEINAFASPGGHIFVTRGLAAAAKSEDALAAAIAHELAHIQLRDGIRAIRSNRDIEDWMGQFFFSGGQIIGDRLKAGFSHTQEFDADIAALSLLVAAGYNPQGLVNILSELEKIQGHGHNSRFDTGFNSTHPSPASRLVNVKVAATRYPNTANISRARQNRFNSIPKN